MCIITSLGPGTAKAGLQGEADRRPVHQTFVKSNKNDRVDAENGLSDDFRVQLYDLWADLQHLDKRVNTLNERLARVVNEDPVTQRLFTLCGVGPLGASALAVVLGDGSAYASGKDFAAPLSGTVSAQYRRQGSLSGHQQAR